MHVKEYGGAITPTDKRLDEIRGDDQSVAVVFERTQDESRDISWPARLYWTDCELPSS